MDTIEDLNVRTRNTCTECNGHNVEEVEDLNVRTRNTCTECNGHNVEEVEDLTKYCIHFCTQDCLKRTPQPEQGGGRHPCQGAVSQLVAGV